MPKQKTHKGAAKRFKVTGTGKVVRGQSMKRHILTKKSTARKRRLRKGVLATRAATQMIKSILHV